ncbi:hypothetical protein PSTG_07036 [Puccinia striiformis f. sp. tritici PST-78]|uniref:Uncharacterized protein n=1 Tax=Puccinia striiformis f. sp. tritici PST-78 TaxID=1165861 RepID=A0A0L0VL54_9BASI|nr:hypothetical protein PSTG_07036 [Puccinia striiformis f. sp. tritici PST-78]
MAEGTLTYMPMELTHDLILEPECKFVKRFSDWIIWVKSKKFSVNMSMKEPKNPSPQSSVRLVLGIQRLPVLRRELSSSLIMAAGVKKEGAAGTNETERRVPESGSTNI